MVSSNILAFAVILLPFIAVAQNVTEICDHVSCGRGTCKSGISYAPFGFTCECDLGWRRTQISASSEEERAVQFLPCVIPNCSMNSNCIPVAAPMPSLTSSTIRNVSFTNPCALAYCGDGKCRNASSGYIHTCECNSGARNLLNTTNFPCYTDCAFESSCTQLGFGVNSSSTSSNSDSANASHAMSSGKLSVVVVWAVLMALVI